MDEAVGAVARVLRYPVKSLRGEAVAACAVDRRGLAGDRWWALATDDGKLASGKSTRRFRAVGGLLDLAAALDGDVPVVTLPGGERLRGDDPSASARLSAALGHRVRLATEGDVGHHDDAPVHLCTTSGLAALEAIGGSQAGDHRRYRPNLVVDVPGPGHPEDDWIGRRLRVGGVELAVTGPAERCVMVTHAQDGLAHHPGLLRDLAAHRDLCAGVYADVVTPGLVREGAPVTLLR